ncbi:MAG: type II secretion system F family protein [Burkholderiales bacterium]|nr:type II secretion system F family protein [Burkholderiales bacterium]
MAIVVLLVLAAAVVALFAWYLWITRLDAQRERLMAGVFDEPARDVSLWKDAADLLQVAALQRLLSRSPLARRLQERLLRVGMPLGLAGFVLAVAAAAVLALLVALLLSGRVDVGLLAFLAVIAITWVVLSMVSASRVRKLELQLPSFVTQMITTLGAGGTPLAAVRNAARNAPAPLGPSMNEIIRRLEIGAAPVEVWRDWAENWNSAAGKLLSTALRIKWDAGGEMSTMLGYVLDQLESRRRMELRVDTLTAQARLASIVLIALPFVIGFITYSFNPHLFQEMLADPIGQKALMVAGALMVVGFFWLRRIARLDS